MEKNLRKNTGKHIRKRNSSYAKRMKGNNRRTLNKKKVAISCIILLFIVIFITKIAKHDKAVETSIEANSNEVNDLNSLQTDTVDNTQIQEQPEEKTKKEITDWRLTLANYENLLPEDFTVEVANIDDTRQFDARAIGELNDMMNAMKKAGITNIWIQSAYRSVTRQKELYDNSIQKYLKQGKTQEEAEQLTNEYINKPGSSDHNLGLAVDFNYVDNKFEKLDGFKWLQENAEDYGFVLRYPKDKEDITKIAYESWHWRYVGVEHAKKMNELNMCLEEYVEYLSEQ